MKNPITYAPSVLALELIGNTERPWDKIKTNVYAVSMGSITFRRRHGGGLSGGAYRACRPALELKTNPHGVGNLRGNNNVPMTLDRLVEVLVTYGKSPANLKTNVESYEISRDPRTGRPSVKINTVDL